MTIDTQKQLKEMDEIRKKQEESFSKMVTDIRNNHNKIIDEFCKAYLSEMVKDGKEISINGLTLFHKQCSPLEKGSALNEYWFEEKKKSESHESKLLRQVMVQLNKLIVYVNDQLSQCQDNPEKIPVLLILDEISGFLNFVDKNE